MNLKNLKKGDVIMFVSHLPTTPNLTITVDSYDSNIIKDVNGKEYNIRDLTFYNKVFILNRKL